jgi:hypothetical protein
METNDDSGPRQWGQAIQVMAQWPGAVSSSKRILARALAERPKPPTSSAKDFHSVSFGNPSCPLSSDTVTYTCFLVPWERSASSRPLNSALLSLHKFFNDTFYLALLLAPCSLKFTGPSAILHPYATPCINILYLYQADHLPLLLSRLTVGDELYFDMVDTFWSGSNFTFPLSSNQAPSSLI